MISIAYSGIVSEFIKFEIFASKSNNKIITQPHIINQIITLLLIEIPEYV